MQPDADGEKVAREEGGEEAVTERVRWRLRHELYPNTPLAVGDLITTDYSPMHRDLTRKVLAIRRGQRSETGITARVDGPGLDRGTWLDQNWLIPADTEKK